MPCPNIVLAGLFWIVTGSTATVCLTPPADPIFGYVLFREDVNSGQTLDQVQLANVPSTEIACVEMLQQARAVGIGLSGEWSALSDASHPFKCMGAPNPDWYPSVDGDAVVGGPDYGALTMAFGSQEGDPDFDTRFDFDWNSTIGGPDFGAFVMAFGGEMR